MNGNTCTNLVETGISKTNGYKPTIPLYVILSPVEVSPSEERGETEERMRRGDLRTNLRGLPKKMLHRVKSHQDFERDPAAAPPCDFSSLFARKNFDSLRMTG